MSPAARPARILGLAAVVVAAAGMLAASPRAIRTHLGPAKPLGAGSVRTFVTLDRDGAPLALGVTLTAGALERLPAVPNSHSRCYDLDGDGRHTGHECMGDEERILELPAEPAAREHPFKWIMVNWNPGGHHAPYARPHFDFHFYTWDRERVEAIAPGRCGELVDCADFERGSRPLAPQYLPEGHIDVGAVVARMGNHLLDSRSPELADSAPFARTFIYGAFDGELIFWEPMITLEFLRSTRDECFEIRQPAAFQHAGHYPTRYCVRQDGDGGHTVALEGFVHRADR